MSRKDYVTIAAAIAKARSEFVSDEYKAATILTAQYIADALAADNPRFDRERFLAAARNESS